jgi:hypothetical protein
MITPGKKHEKFRAVIAEETRTCYSGVRRFGKYLQIFTEGGIITVVESMLLIATTVPTAANPGYNAIVTVWHYIDGGRKSEQCNLLKLVNVP